MGNSHSQDSTQKDYIFASFVNLRAIARAISDFTVTMDHMHNHSFRIQSKDTASPTTYEEESMEKKTKKRSSIVKKLHTAFAKNNQKSNLNRAGSASTHNLSTSTTDDGGTTPGKESSRPAVQFLEEDLLSGNSFHGFGTGIGANSPLYSPHTGFDYRKSLEYTRRSTSISPSTPFIPISLQTLYLADHDKTGTLTSSQIYAYLKRWNKFLKGCRAEYIDLPEWKKEAIRRSVFNAAKEGEEGLVTLYSLRKLLEDVDSKVIWSEDMDEADIEDANLISELADTSQDPYENIVNMKDNSSPDKIAKPHFRKERGLIKKLLKGSSNARNAAKSSTQAQPFIDPFLEIYAMNAYAAHEFLKHDAEKVSSDMFNQGLSSRAKFSEWLLKLLINSSINCGRDFLDVNFNSKTENPRISRIDLACLLQIVQEDCVELSSLSYGLPKELESYFTESSISEAQDREEEFGPNGLEYLKENEALGHYIDFAEELERSYNSLDPNYNGEFNGMTDVAFRALGDLLSRIYQFRGERMEVIGDYEFVKEIGHGAQGVVRVGRSFITGQRVAIKTEKRFDKTNELSHVFSKNAAIENTKSNIAKIYTHENIVQMHEIIATTGYVHFVFEMAGGGSLLEFVSNHADLLKGDGGANDDAPPNSSESGVFQLKRFANENHDQTGNMDAEDTYELQHTIVSGVQHSPSFANIKASGTSTEPYIRRIFRQLILAVDYMHEQGVLHRDLRLLNMTLSDEGDMRLVDFDTAMSFNKDWDMCSSQYLIGSMFYQSPEQIDKVAYFGTKADVWCCGIILYWMLHGHPPFEGEDRPQVFAAISKCKYEISPAISSEAQDLIRKILKRNMRDRPTTKEILKHPWFNGEEESLKSILSSVRVPIKLHQSTYRLDRPYVLEVLKGILQDAGVNFVVFDFQKILKGRAGKKIYDIRVWIPEHLFMFSIFVFQDEQGDFQLEFTRNQGFGSVFMKVTRNIMGVLGERLIPQEQNDSSKSRFHLRKSTTTQTPKRDAKEAKEVKE